jgi:ubiquinone/menaquinone biosynthesis C-methylase UbiE
MSAQSGYVLGHTDRERRRLSIQAAVINPVTETFLRRAGISAGMRVLELGCGVGEVTLMVARLIGPHGTLRSLDLDEHAVESTKSRLKSASHRHVQVEVANVLSFEPAHSFDAVIGRHILIHLADPLPVLQKAVAITHPGGLIAFQEFDFRTVPRGYPEMPLMFSCQDLIVGFFQRAVPNPDIGAKLPWLMQQAGLPAPKAFCEACVDGGPHSLFYEWVTETICSLLPRMEAMGLTTGGEIQIDTLEQRLRQEALETGGFAVISPMIGAFARKP